MIAYLRLLRVGLLLSPAADVVAGMALSALPWSLLVVRTALASMCVYAAGMVLNDHADRVADATNRPERPIPSGQVSANTALLLGLGLLGAGCALSPSPTYHAGLTLLVLGYDYLAKRVLFLGAAIMGTLRALNLLAGGVVAGVTPLPPLLVHAALAYFIYIVAVTLLGALEDQARVKPKAVVSLALVGPLSALVVLMETPHGGAAAGTASALLLLFWFRVLRRPAWDQKSIRRAMTFLLLGTMLYTSLLCAGMGRFSESVAIFVAALAGRRISRSIAVT